MGSLLLGLSIGLAVGIVLGRRSSHAAKGTNVGAVATTEPPVTRIAPAEAVRTEVVAVNKRGRKAGLTDDDFKPADDILTRMQRAWDEGASLEVPDATEPAAEEPPLPEPAAEEPTPVLPPVDPAIDARAQRILERLEAERSTSASTVTEALEEMAAEGYGDDLHLTKGKVACGSCGSRHPTKVIEVDRVLRFEGPSDPADEAIVLGLRCPRCGAKGALVSAFGPDADPELAEAFVYLASRARHR